MKSLTPNIRNLIGITIFSIFISGDCNKEMNVGYHSIPLPGYEKEDYFQMLSNPNEEIQYNAICVLSDMTDAVWLDEDTMKGKPEYLMDLKIYEKIFPRIESGNSWISSAAMRHIGLYDYNQKKYLNTILQNNNPSLNVQLAIWYNFSLRENDILADSALFIKKATFCFDHPSWLVRQSGYKYINRKTAHHFEIKLKKDYAATNEEYTKRQIIKALGMHLCDSSFDFLTNLYTTTKDTSLKKFILGTLPEALNRQQALNWFNNHMKETEMVLDSGIEFNRTESEIYVDLLILGLNKGWDLTRLKTSKITSDPEESKEVFPVLFLAYFEYIHNYETYDSLNAKQIEALKLVERKIASNTSINKQWQEYEKKHLRYLLPKQFIDEQMQITEKYNKALTSLYNRYHTDSSMYDSYLKDLKYLKKDLSIKRVKKIKQQ